MKNEKQPQRQVLLKIFYNDGTVRRVHGKKVRRISYFIQAAKNSDVEKYYIRVTYGQLTDVCGQTAQAINTGECPTKKLMQETLRCFVER